MKLTALQKQIVRLTFTLTETEPDQTIEWERKQTVAEVAVRAGCTQQYVRMTLRKVVQFIDQETD